MSETLTQQTGWKRFLPRIGSPGYHLLLATVAILVLGPLGGVSAAFMNFSIGFFVGGQVLAGILGSAVTLPYGPEGKHGANYMQTMAASVAGMCGMGVLMQAMVWLGLPEPAPWKLVLFYMSIGMFGVGVGMLYTPILVDKMQLSFPSGFAVANPFGGISGGKVDLWTSDNYHGSTFGYYFEGLAVFGVITGLDPRSLGGQERSANELGLSSSQAAIMQLIAFDQLAADGHKDLKPFTPLSPIGGGPAATH